jgi:hypothetical protein
MSTADDLIAARDTFLAALAAYDEAARAYGADTTGPRSVEHDRAVWMAYNADELLRRRVAGLFPPR